jgi:hypothetical protein
MFSTYQSLRFWVSGFSATVSGYHKWGILGAEYPPNTAQQLMRGNCQRVPEKPHPSPKFLLVFDGKYSQCKVDLLA